jgi:polyphenol oxidase
VAGPALPEGAWLRGPLRVPHGVTLRAGGVSAPPFDTLNLGASVGDDPAAVAENRNRVAADLGLAPDRIMRVAQVHGATVRVAGRDDVGSEGDAVIGDDPAWLLAVGAADCLPVLMHDTATGAAAAVHAGWRGAVAGVAVAAVEALVARYGTDPGDLDVWFGPAIRGACYQVGPEVVKAVAAAGGTDATWWRDPGVPGRYRLDVPAFVAAQVLRAGVQPERLRDCGVCTHCDGRTFSHRRDAGRTGRHWAVIRPGGARGRR